MVWFPEADASLVEVSAETRRRLGELSDSRLTEINPPKGQRTLIAVRSNEGKIYFVRVHKVNETWANLSWWPADFDQISFPIKSLNSSKTNTGGTFAWHTSISSQVRFQHGWYTIEDSVITEHSGGGSSKLPYYGPITLKLNVDVKDNLLNLEMQRKERRDGETLTATVGGKTSVPIGTSLKHAESIDSALLSNEHLTLWQGNLVRDDKIVKSVVYAVYLTTPENQGGGFMPPELQKTD